MGNPGRDHELAAEPTPEFGSGTGVKLPVHSADAELERIIKRAFWFFLGTSWVGARRRQEWESNVDYAKRVW
jgi:hypothetical protein